MGSRGRVLGVGCHANNGLSMGHGAHSHSPPLAPSQAVHQLEHVVARSASEEHHLARELTYRTRLGRAADESRGCASRGTERLAPESSCDCRPRLRSKPTCAYLRGCGARARAGAREAGGRALPLGAVRTGSARRAARRASTARRGGGRSGGARAARAGASSRAAAGSAFSAGAA